jgi:3'-5' exonuclease
VSIATCFWPGITTVREFGKIVSNANELSKIMGLPGKPEGIDGTDVERYFLEGKIKEIAEYCEADVVNTYRVWLRYELFRGRLSDAGFQASETYLVNFIKARGA